MSALLMRAARGFLPFALLCLLSALPSSVLAIGPTPALTISPLLPQPLFRYSLSACPLSQWGVSNSLTPVWQTLLGIQRNSTCLSPPLAGYGSLASVGSLHLNAKQSVNLTRTPIAYGSFSMSVLLSVNSTANTASVSLFSTVATTGLSAHSLGMQGNNIYCNYPILSYGSVPSLRLGYVVPYTVYHAGCVYDSYTQTVSGFLRSFDPHTGAVTNVNIAQPQWVGAVYSFTNVSLLLGTAYTGQLGDALLWPQALPVTSMLKMYSDSRVAAVATTQALPNSVGSATGFAHFSSSKLFHTPGVACGGAIRPPTPLMQAISTPATYTATATATLPSTPAMVFDSRLLGLSFEIDQRGIFTNGSNACPMTSLLSMLGPSLLRLGGASLLQLQGFQQSNATHENSIYLLPWDFANLNSFLKPIGWQLILGLPVTPTSNVSNIVAAAVSAARALNSSLYALQLANEPDLQYNATYYAALTQQYWAPIHAALPNVTLADTDASAGVQGPHNATGVMFTSAVYNATAKYTSLISVHYYSQYKPCALSPWTMLDLSSPGLIFSQAAALSVQSKRPVRITEAGSWSSGGAANVSNSFASAFWILTFAQQLTQWNISGANMHGGLASGWYSPIVNSGYAPNVTAVNAQYYAMLLLSIASYPQGSFVNTSLTAASLPAGVTAQCVRTNTSYNFILTNANTALSLNISLLAPSTPIMGILVTYLTAPNMSSTAGFTFGGVSFDSLMAVPSRNGSIAPVAPQSYVLQNGHNVVYLPPLTIALAQVQYAM